MKLRKILLLIISILVLNLISCEVGEVVLTITNGEEYTLEVGESVDLDYTFTGDESLKSVWVTESDILEVDSEGIVIAKSAGSATVRIEIGTYSDEITIIVNEVILVDPYVNMTKEEFYSDYKIATSYMDSYYRSLHGFMSGSITPQDQEPEVSAYQPRIDGVLVRNSSSYYSEDKKTYTIVDCNGDKVMDIYEGGAYVTLEEVAAYVLAFNDIPANYSSSKKTKPTESIWGEYLRLNHTQFTGSTTKYPYEPELPNISGCGGKFMYFEIDLGTTGTDCDPSYSPRVYNNGSTIVRGAARIVYSRCDLNRNEIIDINERFVFYTYNHYNDFQEYLNYYGGWGEIFGNITGGGEISSKYNYNPTQYVEAIKARLS